MQDAGYRSKLVLVILFAVAMGYLEAAVVVYLRELFYPEGFAFPLKAFSPQLLVVELGRELATLIMLVTAAIITGRKAWERFGWLVLLFGAWDIFYYVWLKLLINWPGSPFDWDILFLIPLPWIGPVIAPILVSAVMIAAGFFIIRLYSRGRDFRPTLPAWVLAAAATGLVLFSFMRDTGATIRQQPPQPYLWGLLFVGLLLYFAAFAHAYRRSRADRTQ